MPFHPVRIFSAAGLAALLVLAVCEGGAREPAMVHLARVPAGGLQPQAALDRQGVLHLIYLAGDPAAADIYYVRKGPHDADFSVPLRVNSQSGSAIALGTIRGAQIAIGRAGRVHVAWNGSRTAQPQGPGGATPMLYSRLNESGTAFEPQRNVIQAAYGLDGGGSLAADSKGGVFVFWHAPVPGTQGETNRAVWIARSYDDGSTFARETRAWSEPTGACGCCGMRAMAGEDGTLYALYRAATGGVDRDTVLLVSRDRGTTFRGTRVHPWKLNACPMSSAFLAPVKGGALAAWETEKQVYFARADERTLRVTTPVAAPGEGSRKHPVMAVNAAGDTILVWTEGTGWKKGGSLRWQVFDSSGATKAESGVAPGVSAWSLAAVYPRPDGGFTILY
ncbi:MAG TPA: hypothetical protein VFA33_22715 [Bryobacteraceae bacterium]|nr:hypothetical protein [Bryobacteraceae bacterium]